MDLFNLFSEAVHCRTGDYLIRELDVMKAFRNLPLAHLVDGKAPEGFGRIMLLYMPTVRQELL